MIASAEGLHICNLFQWNAEGKVRDPTRSDATVARLKREIDASNLARHGHVERFDALCLETLVPRRAAPLWDGLQLNSETLGQIADRVSVLTAKLAHHARRPAGAELAELAALQLRHLAVCYDRFLFTLIDGSGYMPLFKQLKSYAGSEFTDAVAQP